MLHGCKIEDNCLIGMVATILDGAIIGQGKHCWSKFSSNCWKNISPRSLIMGSPAGSSKRAYTRR